MIRRVLGRMPKVKLDYRDIRSLVILEEELKKKEQHEIMKAKEKADAARRRR